MTTFQFKSGVRNFESVLRFLAADSDNIHSFGAGIMEGDQYLVGIENDDQSEVVLETITSKRNPQIGFGDEKKGNRMKENAGERLPRVAIDGLQQEWGRERKQPHPEATEYSLRRSNRLDSKAGISNFDRVFSFLANSDTVPSFSSSSCSNFEGEPLQAEMENEECPRETRTSSRDLVSERRDNKRRDQNSEEEFERGPFIGESQQGLLHLKQELRKEENRSVLEGTESWLARSGSGTNNNNERILRFLAADSDNIRNFPLGSCSISEEEQDPPEMDNEDQSESEMETTDESDVQLACGTERGHQRMEQNSGHFIRRRSTGLSRNGLQVFQPESEREEKQSVLENARSSLRSTKSFESNGGASLESVLRFLADPDAIRSASGGGCRIFDEEPDPPEIMENDDDQSESARETITDGSDPQIVGGDESEDKSMEENSGGADQSASFPDVAEVCMQVFQEQLEREEKQSLASEDTRSSLRRAKSSESNRGAGRFENVLRFLADSDNIQSIGAGPCNIFEGEQDPVEIENDDDQSSEGVRETTTAGSDPEVSSGGDDDESGDEGTEENSRVVERDSVLEEGSEVGFQVVQPELEREEKQSPVEGKESWLKRARPLESNRVGSFENILRFLADSDNVRGVGTSAGSVFEGEQDPLEIVNDHQSENARDTITDGREPRLVRGDVSVDHTMDGNSGEAETGSSPEVSEEGFHLLQSELELEEKQLVLEGTKSSLRRAKSLESNGVGSFESVLRFLADSDDIRYLGAGAGSISEGEQDLLEIVSNDISEGVTDTITDRSDRELVCGYDRRIDESSGEVERESFSEASHEGLHVCQEDVEQDEKQSLVEGSLVEGSLVEGSLVEGSLVEGSLVEGSLVEGTEASLSRLKSFESNRQARNFESVLRFVADSDKVENFGAGNYNFFEFEQDPVEVENDDQSEGLKESFTDGSDPEVVCVDESGDNGMEENFEEEPTRAADVETIAAEEKTMAAVSNSISRDDNPGSGLFDRGANLSSLDSSFGSIASNKKKPVGILRPPKLALNVGNHSQSNLLQEPSSAPFAAQPLHWQSHQKDSSNKWNPQPHIQPRQISFVTKTTRNGTRLTLSSVTWTDATRSRTIDLNRTTVHPKILRLPEGRKQKVCLIKKTQKSKLSSKTVPFLSRILKKPLRMSASNDRSSTKKPTGILRRPKSAWSAKRHLLSDSLQRPPSNSCRPASKAGEQVLPEKLFKTMEPTAAHTKETDLVRNSCEPDRGEICTLRSSNDCSPSKGKKAEAGNHQALSELQSLSQDFSFSKLDSTGSPTSATTRRDDPRRGLHDSRTNSLESSVSSIGSSTKKPVSILRQSKWGVSAGSHSVSGLLQEPSSNSCGVSADQPASKAKRNVPPGKPFETREPTASCATETGVVCNKDEPNRDEIDTHQDNTGERHHAKNGDSKSKHFVRKHSSPSIREKTLIRSQKTLREEQILSQEPSTSKSDSEDKTSVTITTTRDDNAGRGLNDSGANLSSLDSSFSSVASSPKKPVSILRRPKWGLSAESHSLSDPTGVPASETNHVSNNEKPVQDPESYTRRDNIIKKSKLNHRRGSSPSRKKTVVRRKSKKEPTKNDSSSKKKVGGNVSSVISKPQATVYGSDRDSDSSSSGGDELPTAEERRKMCILPHKAKHLFQAQTEDKSLGSLIAGGTMEREMAKYRVDGYDLVFFNEKIYIPQPLRVKTMQCYEKMYTQSSLHFLERNCFWPELQDDWRLLTTRNVCGRYEFKPAKFPDKSTALSPRHLSGNGHGRT